jgi:hypothetical protein
MDQMRVRLAVVDATKADHAVQKFVGRFPGRVLMADYSLTKPDLYPAEKVKGHPRVRIARTEALDLGAELIIGDGQSGDLFPVLPTVLHRELISHLCAPKRTTEDTPNGGKRVVWRETSPDHLRHAHVYQTVAADLMLGLNPRRRLRAEQKAA